MANPTLATLPADLLDLFLVSQAIAADVLARDGAEPVLNGTIPDDDVAAVQALAASSLSRLAA